MSAMSKRHGHSRQEQETSAASQSSVQAAKQGHAATRAWVAAAASRLGVTEGTVRRWIRTGRLNPSCGQIYALVLPYIDRELSADERATVDRHIAACPGCDEHFAFDGAVLRFVRQRAPRPLMPEGMADRLLAPFRGREAPER